jgi:probable F420-dependent oxidoreductase
MSGRVRLTVFLPTFAAEDPGGWDHVLARARAADLAGVDRVVVSDHVAFGEDLDAYGQPATGGVEGGRQPTGPDGHWLEPVTVLTAVAAQTDRIRLGTYILLAALRRPVVLAKQLATLDVLSGGRVDLGVGIGWQREEYEAAGLDFGARGRLLDHTLEVCRALWCEERASYASAELRFERIHAMPKPLPPGGIPIWVSGRANPRVARRLARFGAGWIPWAEDAADPSASVPRMRSLVEQAGGDPAFAVLAPLPLVPGPGGAIDPVATMDGLPALVDAGVTDVLAHVRAPESFEGAREAYSELVDAFRTVTDATGRVD